MDMIDWKMVSVILSSFQFIFMAVVFSIIKFNDLKHLDDDVKSLKEQQSTYENKNNERHEENLKAINALTVEITKVITKCKAYHDIKK